MAWTERFDYVPIVDRKVMKLPDSARVAVWVIVNIEEWDIHRPMARTVLPPPGGGTNPPPDVPNYSWYDYGLRVGVWRLMEVLDRHGIKATVSLNGSVCTSYPRLVEAMLKADWELMGHSYIQRPMTLEQDQAGMIRQTMATIREASGQPPRGWMGPGLTETDAVRENVPEETKKALIARTPLGRIGAPSDIADVVAFLASSDARWITGQVLLASGGFTP